MNERAIEMIRTLRLAPHPEGGHYREIYRSSTLVNGSRSAVTTIYFLLTQGEKSLFHRIGCDEIWHFYEGDALELIWLSEDMRSMNTIALGGEQGGTRVHVIPPRCYQAARPKGEYALVGCTVAPGFEFGDFKLLRDDDAARKTILSQHSGLIELV